MISAWLAASASVVIEAEPDWDMAAQPAPDYAVDRQVNW
jgi:hypothetical protein